MPAHSRVPIEKRHERYLIRVIEAEDSTKKEKAEASRQLTRLRELKAQRLGPVKPARTASNVLGG